MLTEERHLKIVNLVRSQNIVKIAELTKLLDTSESTIRRDLEVLEKDGVLKRIHGGAKNANSMILEPSMNQKSQIHAAEKKLIAQAAVKQLRNGDVVFLDAGSTTLALIDYLTPDLQLKFVTNSVEHALRLIEKNFATIILGGEIKLSTQATYGHAAVEQLAPYRFSKAFIGANGIDLSAGITTPDPAEALIKQQVITQTKDTYILADACKFQNITFTKFADLTQVKIITDQLDFAEASSYFNKTEILETRK